MLLLYTSPNGGLVDIVERVCRCPYELVFIVLVGSYELYTVFEAKSAWACSHLECSIWCGVYIHTIGRGFVGAALLCERSELEHMLTGIEPADEHGATAAGVVGNDTDG